MTIDFDKLAAKREEVEKMTKGGGDFWKVPVGETKFFLHDQCRPEDDHPATGGYNFIEFHQHFGTGKKGHVCLDPNINPVLMHPVVQKYMSDRKKDKFVVSSKTECPTCKALKAGTIKGSDADERTGKARYLWGVTPMFYRESKIKPWTKLKFEPRTLLAGPQVFGGISESMITDDHANVCDPKAAILMIITRKGTGFGDTEYSVRLDTETIKKPLAMDKGQRRMLSEAMAVGGSCDLHKVLANLAKSVTAIKAAMMGVVVEEDEAAADGIEQKACFGLDYIDGDADCADCPDAQECAAAKTGEVVETEAAADDGNGGELVDPDEAECGSAEDDDASDSAELEGEEFASEDAEDIIDAEQMHCWGTWEKENEGCQGCAFRDECAGRTASLAAAAAAAKTKGAAKGKTPGANNRPPIGKAPPTRGAVAPAAVKAASVPAKKVAAPAGKAAAVAPADDDPDLDAIQAEADKLIASRKVATVAGRASAR